jgi:hypothetical protein
VYGLMATYRYFTDGNTQNFWKKSEIKDGKHSTSTIGRNGYYEAGIPNLDEPEPKKVWILAI